MADVNMILNASMNQKPAEFTTLHEVHLICNLNERHEVYVVMMLSLETGK